MNSKTSAQRNPSDVIKWLLAIALTMAGVIANNYYHEIAWPLRLAGWIVLTIIVLAITLNTTQGIQFHTFFKESRMELRKVEWPSRQETIQFTIGVVVMVMVMALALWLIDTTLLWIVKWFTG